MSEDLLIQFSQKNPLSIFLSKPVTPKKLTMFRKSYMTPQDTKSKIPAFENFETVSKKNSKNQILNKTQQLDSPVPEFAKEFVYSNPTSKIQNRKNSHFKRYFDSSPPSCKNSFKHLRKTPSKTPVSKSNTRSKSNLSVTDPKEPTLHKILRLFKPQIMKFKDKSHIQVFTTVSSAVKKSKVKLSRRLQILNEVHRKKKSPPKELSVEVFEPQESYLKDYTRPALTFGEKLWKLNEISVLNIG